MPLEPLLVGDEQRLRSQPGEIGTKTHGLQAVTVNGRTRIGMGCLGAGKVAKLAFRAREELQRLKAETRP